SNEQFFKLFNQSPDARIVTQSETSKILFVNRAYEQMFSVNAEELLGEEAGKLQFLPAEDRERISRYIVQLGRIRGLEYRMKVGTGELRDMLFNIELIDLEG